MKTRLYVVLIWVFFIPCCGEYVGFGPFPEADLGNIKQIRVYVDGESLQKLHSSVSIGDDYYAPCIFLEGEHRLEASIKVRGNWGRQFPKKSFTVKVFSGGETIRHTFDASDDPWIKNRIAMFAYRRVGLPAPDTEGVAFFVNDEYLGYYTMADMYGERELQEYYHGKQGQLFKWVVDSLCEIPLHGLSEKKFPADNDYSRLDALIHSANNLGDVDWFDWVASNVDRDEMVKYMVVHDFLGVTDTRTKNLYVYDYGKLLMLPWDHDRCMASEVAFGGDNPLTQRLIQEPYVRSEYIRQLRRLFLDPGEDNIVEDLVTEANRIFDEVDRAIFHDPIAYRDYQEYLAEKQSVLDFLNHRADALTYRFF